MRFLSLFALLFAVAAHALSATGGERLLVLLDDVTEKAEYSTFLGDLESTFASEILIEECLVSFEQLG